MEATHWQFLLASLKDQGKLHIEGFQSTLLLVDMIAARPPSGPVSEDQRLILGYCQDSVPSELPSQM